MMILWLGEGMMSAVGFCLLIANAMLRAHGHQRWNLCLRLI